MIGRGAACQCQIFLNKVQCEEKLVHRFDTSLRLAGFNLKQFNQTIRIPHLFSVLRTVYQKQYSETRQIRLQLNLCPLVLKQVAADPQQPNKHASTPHPSA